MHLVDFRWRARSPLQACTAVVPASAGGKLQFATWGPVSALSDVPYASSDASPKLTCIFVDLRRRAEAHCKLKKL